MDEVGGFLAFPQYFQKTSCVGSTELEKRSTFQLPAHRRYYEEPNPCESVKVFMQGLILSFFGISLPVVQVGGGLIVISAGWSMLNQREDSDRDAASRTVSCTNALKEAFYPLTLPLTVGPGSISVAITLGANGPHQFRAGLLAIAAAAIGSAFVAATIYLCYAFADRLGAMIGPTGVNVTLKLSAFLLVCIGVQILWNGVSQLVHSLALRP